MTKLPPHIVDQFRAAYRDADAIADILIADNLPRGSTLEARDAVSEPLRQSLQATAARSVGCPHTGDRVFESPQPIVVSLAESIGSCVGCLPNMQRISKKRGLAHKGCDFCPNETVATTLIAKDHHAVWLAEICDDCATTVTDAQRDAFGEPQTNPPEDLGDDT